ncbi:DUF805 domain-containing protein [Thiorhodococcus mannitoliphagus]|uniref:DUF805 domain-containing protein n=1 Tax=Thiorhodococcus mannitoliphagus TaxID=329406 RepID=A0A6P1DSL1_9GAMM|nr:DUF805 domain-containing protein [Thiorhodococcus mannitoliphagus]NEX19002.1 DUF805 domain-containing protein [Thiorhodococcus mannitoliphagus]
MNSGNPYQPPISDLRQPSTGKTDQSSVFSPSGRFARLSYIAWGTLLYMVLILIVAALAAAGLVDTTATESPVLEIAISIPAAVVGILFGIRRLHDINASGWWMLVSLVPIVNLGLALMLFLKAGTPDANRFAAPRPAPTWERVVGIIGVVLLVLSLVGIVAAILIPLVVGVQTGA